MTESGQSSASFAAMVGRTQGRNLRLSRQLLLVPVAGSPIQLVRTYDSRDKSRGDFGVGRNLGLRNVRVEKSAGWASLAADPDLGILPELRPAADALALCHRTFPTGKVYRYRGGTANPCQALYPITDGTLTFSPVAATWARSARATWTSRSRAAWTVPAGRLQQRAALSLPTSS
jgi:hypothetical protein